jgi:hypothetical protein
MYEPLSDDVLGDRFIDPSVRPGDDESPSSETRENAGSQTWVKISDIVKTHITAPFDPAPLVQLQSDLHHRTLNTWECVVMTAPDGSGDFDASLHDLSDPGFVDEMGTFNVCAVPAPDRDLIRVGNVFYFFTGSTIDKFGTIEHVWRLRFRRLPRWSRTDLTRVDAEANDLVEMLGEYRGETDSAAER